MKKKFQGVFAIKYSTYYKDLQPTTRYINNTTRLANDYDFDHILGSDFSRENDRLTGYNRISLLYTNLWYLSPGLRQSQNQIANIVRKETVNLKRINS